ncbi:hypothetical protein ACWC24_36825 [Streptomyces sp. NPDC001443]
MDPAEVTTVLPKPGRWRPFNSEAVLDDAAPVHERRPPPLNCCGTFPRPGDMPGPHGDRRVRVAPTPHLPGLLRPQETPSDHRQAVGRLRPMAWGVSELFEPLVELRWLRETV